MSTRTSYRLRNAVIMGWLAVGLIACGESNRGPLPDPCPELWGVKVVQDRPEDKTRVTVLDGALVMDVRQPVPPLSAVLTQEDAGGDFTALLHFEQFEPGDGKGTFLRLVLHDPLQPDSGMVMAQINDSSISAQVRFTEDHQLVKGTEGSFLVQREGKKVTVVTTSAGAVATVSADFFGTYLDLSLEMGAALDTVFGNAFVRIPQFEFTPDSIVISGMRSDAFDCVSIPQDEEE